MPMEKTIEYFFYCALKLHGRFKGVTDIVLSTIKKIIVSEGRINTSRKSVQQFTALTPHDLLKRSP
jgi:hypothetical protein